MTDDRVARTVTRLVIAFLVALILALIFVPNRYWVGASKRLVPPEKFRASSRPDPWG